VGEHIPSTGAITFIGMFKINHFSTRKSELYFLLSHGLAILELTTKKITFVCRFETKITGLRNSFEDYAINTNLGFKITFGNLS
jgi:hypothetical protein